MGILACTLDLFQIQLQALGTKRFLFQIQLGHISNPLDKAIQRKSQPASQPPLASLSRVNPQKQHYCKRNIMKYRWLQGHFSWRNSKMVGIRDKYPDIQFNNIVGFWDKYPDIQFRNSWFMRHLTRRTVQK